MVIKYCKFIFFLFLITLIGSVSYAEPHKQLSDYNFFKDIKNQIPRDETIPYKIANPLFSDYSHKFRFVHMPLNTAAEYSYNNVFNFPVGTTIIKTFAYPIDERNLDKGFLLLETRLLIKNENGWIPLSYIWNNEQTNAFLKYTGHTFNVSWISSNGQEKYVRYRAPNVNQCKSCHEINNKIQPIGPKGRNMNINFVYPNGEANQIDFWHDKSLLNNIPKPLKKNPAIWDDTKYEINERARSYLDANCAHCHQRGASASNSGFYLNIEENNSSILGIYKTPVAAGRGSGGLKYIIDPGKPADSILLYRMLSTDPGVMMPELSRNLQHEEAIPLIREWISQLK